MDATMLQDLIIATICVAIFFFVAILSVKQQKKQQEERKRQEEEREARREARQSSRSASRREEATHREAVSVAPRPTQPTPSVPLYEGHFPQEKSFIQQG